MARRAKAPKQRKPRQQRTRRGVQFTLMLKLLAMALVVFVCGGPYQEATATKQVGDIKPVIFQLTLLLSGIWAISEIIKMAFKSLKETPSGKTPYGGLAALVGVVVFLMGFGFVIKTHHDTAATSSTATTQAGTAVAYMLFAVGLFVWDQFRTKQSKHPAPHAADVQEPYEEASPEHTTGPLGFQFTEA